MCKDNGKDMVEDARKEVFGNVDLSLVSNEEVKKMDKYIEEANK